MLFVLRCGYLMIFSLCCVSLKFKFTQATTVVFIRTGGHPISSVPSQWSCVHKIPSAFD
jgi:hypothetical protein